MKYLNECKIILGEADFRKPKQLRMEMKDLTVGSTRLYGIFNEAGVQGRTEDQFSFFFFGGGGKFFSLCPPPLKKWSLLIKNHQEVNLSSLALIQPVCPTI